MNLQKVLELVDGFHITDRRLLRARRAVARDSGPATMRAFVSEVRRYFLALEREAGDQIVSADRRLDDVYQRQYNLQAERAVAERRRDGARSVLQALEE